jgi:hypothetical protein
LLTGQYPPGRAATDIFVHFYTNFEIEMISLSVRSPILDVIEQCTESCNLTSLEDVGRKKMT